MPKYNVTATLCQPINLVIEGDNYKDVYKKSVDLCQKAYCGNGLILKHIEVKPYTEIIQCPVCNFEAYIREDIEDKLFEYRCNVAVCGTRIRHHRLEVVKAMLATLAANEDNND